MITVGITFSKLEEEEFKEVALDLQRFIVEDDYVLHLLVTQLQEEKMVVLEVSNEENMPNLTTVLEGFDEEEIEYKLFKKENNNWDLCKLSDLKLDRSPRLTSLIIISLVGYFIFSFLEIFAIYDWFTIEYKMNGFLAFILSIMTAFVPFVGSVFAYFGATELWHWESTFTLFLYFWYYLPLVGFMFYLFWLFFWVNFKDVWYDFWNPEFKH